MCSDFYDAYQIATDIESQLVRHHNDAIVQLYELRLDNKGGITLEQAVSVLCTFNIFVEEW
jgi:hypothetical protein